ncbi:MAG: hypothetical protein JSV04_13715 [Candidatus Heimdallarchaeota archaeon]|nr:MAG: hypothetical protein JSV04_13715 [Candidatus Heimdallarchaeota archaeon]
MMNPNATHFFVMCPPFEIVEKKRQVIVANRGVFEISRNKIQYIVADVITDYLVLQPEDGIGIMTELPPNININSFHLLNHLCEGMSEICFSIPGYQKENLLLDFLFGDILPFTMKQFESGFFQLEPLPQTIYEEFYRMSMSIEDVMTTTIATFDENVFIPFKQKFISAIHNKTAENTKSDVNFSRDFPRFFSLHQNLLTILLSQAKQVSDHQHLSFYIFAPILRKMRMLNTLKAHSELKRRKNRVEIKINPIKVDSKKVVEKITPLVGVK